jgi:hypothetical protein
MREVYPKSFIANIDSELYPNVLIEEIFEFCEDENKNITRDDLADLLIKTNTANKLLLLWDGQTKNGKDLYGTSVVNDVLSFTQRKNESGNVDVINLVVRATSTVGTNNLIVELLSGMVEIAKRLELGEKDKELEKVERIVMTSWLLGPAFDDKLKKILGSDIRLNEWNGPKMGDSQRWALRYNKQSLINFLQTGHAPEVRNLIMTRNIFIGKKGHWENLIKEIEKGEK